MAGVAGVVFDVLDEEKVLAQFFLRDQVRRLVIMFGELAHGPHVTFLSARGQTAQVQTLDHSLAQFSHGYTSRLKLDLSSGSVGGWDSPLIVIELTQRDGGKSSSLRVALSSTIVGRERR